ncbi:unnamed protein product [Moneuplotes crassus]|uniref:Uncharacterized protein n=1 Tax=Euplotes crassus TaxID=5936 RepID=A0AAD1XLI3_EUPCR|nr:unnamed protein product [Moneuplotes crassus]
MEFVKDKVAEVKKSLDKIHEKDPMLVYTFALIGAGYVGFKLLKDIRGMLRYTVRPSYDLKKRYGSNWCVVTGATDGIGKGFAFELSRRGMKVVLVARNDEKLQAVAKEINETYEGAETKTIVFDFNQNYTSEVIKELTEKFDEIEKCSILVNNVGVLFAGMHGDMEDDGVMTTLNINITANTLMAKIFIPKLLANETRAGMVNVGGYLSYFPCPFLTVYSASKAYMTQFSTSLSEEYKHKIDILVTNSGSIKTNMNDGRFLFTITPAQHANAVLNKLGHDTWTCGHAIHAVHQYLLEKPIEGAIIKYINNKRFESYFTAQQEQADAN